MRIPASLIQAANGPEPTRQLIAEVTTLRDSGSNQAQLSDWLNALLLNTREATPNSEAVEAILDVLDLVEGWCPPSVAVFPPVAVNS